LFFSGFVIEGRHICSVSVFLYIPKNSLKIYTSLK
jgi:hypothetical protein